MKLILSNKNNLEIFGKRLYRMDFLYSFFVYKEIKFIFFKLFLVYLIILMEIKD